MTSDAFNLIRRLVATPSFSRDEDATATLIYNELKNCGINARRHLNNIWAVSDIYDITKPTLLLNSHHDTVKPVASYTIDPFKPVEKDGRIYGLGSNDAGASVVSLIETFKQLHSRELSVNLILAITAEEEVSGSNGIEALLRQFKDRGLHIDMAIVGEPTSMQPAIAERGLLVLDCTAHGISGHAARNEGVNAIYKALSDIFALQTFKFDKTSQVLGDIKISITQINAGTQHNVVPDTCKFVADIRTTDALTNPEIVSIISNALQSDVSARSTRLNASVIDIEHPLVKAAIALGGKPFVSPTLSDRALMNGIPALKLGPGESSRSHTADEYILKSEIEYAIDFYKNLILSI